LFKHKKANIVLVGLDAAGKTTILYKMKIGEIETVPVIGFNLETLKFNDVKITSFDLGYDHFIRRLYPHFLQNTSAVIFIVDSNDYYHER
jgi:GTPase SAR1 family protein